ncbi:MAG TPA: MFS transporter [Sporichthyaceae bacterium]|jgi:MFS family permease
MAPEPVDVAAPALPRPRTRTMAVSNRVPFRLGPRASFALLASMAVTFLAASNAPTPLYPIYQQQWGFSPIITTAIFSVYAVSVLATLLTIGALSDHVGRRPVLYGALATQAVALGLFAAADGVAMLVAARLVQGISIGAAMGAMGAGLLDLHKERGATASAVGPLIGTGLGAEIAGIFVQWLPAPEHLIYLALLGVLAVQTVGVALMPETVTSRPGALTSLRPQFALPPAARRPLLVAIPALLATWAMGGFYGSLGPALVRRITGSNSHVYAGSPLFVLAACAGFGVLALMRTPPRTLMLLGTAALVVGVGVTLLAAVSSTTAFFLATVVAGIGFGAAFQGAFRSVAMVAGPHERAGVLSVLFVVSYVAFGGPAIAAGVLAEETGDIMTTARYYGAAVMVLAAVAFLALLRPTAEDL